LSSPRSKDKVGGRGPPEEEEAKVPSASPSAMEGGAHEFDGSTFKECFSLSWRNPYVLRLAFSAGIGGLLFGYDTGACVRAPVLLPSSSASPF